jgi:hypothetical protein
MTIFLGIKVFSLKEGIKRTTMQSNETLGNFKMKKNYIMNFQMLEQINFLDFHLRQLVLGF